MVKKQNGQNGSYEPVSLISVISIIIKPRILFYFYRITMVKEQNGQKGGYEVLSPQGSWSSSESSPDLPTGTSNVNPYAGWKHGTKSPCCCHKTQPDPTPAPSKPKKTVKFDVVHDKLEFLDFSKAFEYCTLKTSILAQNKTLRDLAKAYARNRAILRLVRRECKIIRSELYELGIYANSLVEKLPPKN